MFNFFKKKREIIPFFARFQDSFTEEQKRAIFFCHYEVMFADGKLTMEESKFFKEVTELFDYKFENRRDEMSYDEMLRILKTLNVVQKDWFIISIHSIVFVNGYMERSAMDMVIEIFRGVGISAFYARKVIKSGIKTASTI